MKKTNPARQLLLVVEIDWQTHTPVTTSKQTQLILNVLQYE